MAHYCYECGDVLEWRTREGDEKAHESCLRCGFVAYQNPGVQGAMVLHHGEKILWMQRAEDPRSGYWELPGGFMETGESLEQAAVRETLEETGASVIHDSVELYVVGTLRFMHEVRVIFRAQAVDEGISLGSEAKSAGWYSEENAPWNELAYPEVGFAMRLFYRDLREGRYGIYYGEHDGTSISLWDKVRGVRQS